MSVEHLGRLMMIGFDGVTLPEETAGFIHDAGIGFVILFSRNIESVEQVRRLTAAIHAAGKVPPLIYTDQEGGGIVRFGELAATAISAMGLAAGGEPANAFIAGKLIGRDMKGCGIDGVFAPVLDVNVEAANPVIGIRSYSDLPETVLDYARAFRRGLHESGVLSCGKHFPGHGAAASDSHLVIPEIPVSYQYFKYYCLHPFKVMADEGIESMMTAHVRFPLIDCQIATFSSYLVRDLLREEIGYNGVVFSDCLEMKAVRDYFTVDQIVLNLMEAEVDVMVPSHTIEFQRELLDRLAFFLKNGTVSETRVLRSLERINRLRGSLPIPEQFHQEDTDPQIPCLEMRAGIDSERALAEASITLLRHRRNALPLEVNQKTLLLEWKKEITGPSVQENQNRSMVETCYGDFLTNSEYRPIQPVPGRPVPVDIEKALHGRTAVVLFIYARTQAEDRLQMSMVKQLLKIRKDIILVSLESPYEIKKYPSADTFLVSYGFRRVQVEALFKILTGKILPAGRLPVEIPGVAVRGYGIHNTI